MASLPKRTIGGIESTALGFGCMSLTDGFYGEGLDETETEKTLRKALDLGVSLLNTADFYTSMTSGKTRQNLKLIGRVLKDYPREKITIVMKWGIWVEGGFKPADVSPAGCRSRVEKALEVLGTDYIDVLVLRQNPMGGYDVPLEEVAEGMKAMVAAGKVKAIGTSEFGVEDIKKIHAVVPVKVLELEWSLFTRDSEKEIVPFARSIGAGFLAYSPMGRGVLTGKFDAKALDKSDFRHHNARFSDDSLNNNLKLVQLVDEMAKEKGCTAGQLAIAFLLAMGDDIVPIPGTKRIPYLEENLKAVNVKLTKEEVQKLRNIVPESEVAGNRY